MKDFGFDTDCERNLSLCRKHNGNLELIMVELTDVPSKPLDIKY